MDFLLRAPADWKTRRRSVSMDNIFVAYAGKDGATERSFPEALSQELLGSIRESPSDKAPARQKASNKSEGGSSLSGERVPGISHAQARRMRQASIGSVKDVGELTLHESKHIEKRQRELQERKRKEELHQAASAAAKALDLSMFARKSDMAWREAAGKLKAKQAVEQHASRHNLDGSQRIPRHGEEEADARDVHASVLQKHVDEERVKMRREFLDEVLDKYRARGCTISRLHRHGHSRLREDVLFSHMNPDAHATPESSPASGKGGGGRAKLARRREFWVELRARVKRVSAEGMEREIRLAQDEHLPEAVNALMRFECSHTSLPHALQEVKDLLARVEGAIETAFPRISQQRHGKALMKYGRHGEIHVGGGGGQTQLSWCERSAQSGVADVYPIFNCVYSDEQVEILDIPCPPVPDSSSRRSTSGTAQGHLKSLRELKSLRIEPTASHAVRGIRYATNTILRFFYLMLGLFYF
jgi:hypothetical protein